MARIVLLSARLIIQKNLLTEKSLKKFPSFSSRIIQYRSLLQNYKCRKQQQLRFIRTQPSPTPNNNCNKNVENKTILSKMFGKYLLLTNIVSSGVLMVVGDTAAQEIERYRRKHSGKNGEVVMSSFDYRRMWCMFVVGCIMGVPHHYVYNWMDRIMPAQNMKTTINKILIDEFFMSPLCIFLFFYGAGFVEKKTIKETTEEMKSKFVTIYLTDWLVWPGIQYVNFRYLPTKYRVIVVNVATALYDIFLSYMKYDYDNH